MKTLLLTAAGTLSLSTAALAADAARYEYDGMTYTFTSSGEFNEALDATEIILQKSVDLTVVGNLSAQRLELYAGSALQVNNNAYLSESYITINGNSKIKADSIDLSYATINMKLTGGNIETSCLTLDASFDLVLSDDSAIFNLEFTGVLTGDYKLVTLDNSARDMKNEISNCRFGFNYTPMTDAERAKLRWDNNTLVYSAGAVPEPSLFGVLAGLGALALASTRRRRK